MLGIPAIGRRFSGRIVISLVAPKTEELASAQGDQHPRI